MATIRTTWLGVALVTWAASGACQGSVDLGGGGGTRPTDGAGDAQADLDVKAGTPGADGSTAEGAVEGVADATPDASGPALSTDAPAEASFTEGDAFAEAAPLEAAMASCNDQMKDGTETDVDCGGEECPGCGPRKECALDSDCSTTLSGCNAAYGGCTCDAISMTCVYDHCFDDKKDDGETDVDCGGSECSPCATGRGCALDGDCTTSACDGVQLLCVANQCVDHRQDGIETDVDCGGGGGCLRCAVGKKCNASTDCQAGRTCSTTLPTVCQ